MTRVPRLHLNPFLGVALALTSASCGSEPQGPFDASLDTDGPNSDGSAADATLDASPDSGLDPLDRAMLAEVALAARTSKASASAIWDESGREMTFELHTIPLYFVRQDEAGTGVKGFLIQRTTPPPGAAEVPDAAATDLGPIYRWDDDIEILAGEYFDYTSLIAGVSTYAYAYSNLADEPSNPTNPLFLVVVAHEAFHRYQIVEGGWLDNPCATQDEASYPMTAENVGLALLEHRVLAAGAQATEQDDKVLALRRFYAVRASRIALPGAVVGGVNFVSCLDESQEQMEGTARYAEIAFDRAAGLPDDVIADNVAELEMPFEAEAFVDAADARDYFAFGRFYASGALVGELLDDASAADWRSLCAQGSGPSDWVELAFPDLPQSDTESLLEQSKEEYDWPSIVARADEIVSL